MILDERWLGEGWALENDMELRHTTRFEDDTMIVTVIIPRRVREDLGDYIRNLERNFEGGFNVNNLQLINSDCDVDDWVLLHPESLSMQFLRLAYLAALVEEGSYGADV